MLRRFVTIPSLATTPSFVISLSSTTARCATTTTEEENQEESAKAVQRIFSLYASLDAIEPLWKNYRQMTPQERSRLAKKQAILRNMIAKYEMEHYGKVFIQKSKFQEKQSKRSAAKKLKKEKEKEKKRLEKEQKKLEKLNKNPRVESAEPKQTEKHEAAPNVITTTTTN